MESGRPGDPGGLYGPRWELSVSHVADVFARIEELVRREHAFRDPLSTSNARTAPRRG